MMITRIMGITPRALQKSTCPVIQIRRKWLLASSRHMTLWEMIIRWTARLITSYSRPRTLISGTSTARHSSRRSSLRILSSKVNAWGWPKNQLMKWFTLGCTRLNSVMMWLAHVLATTLSLQIVALPVQASSDATKRSRRTSRAQPWCKRTTKVTARRVYGIHNRRRWRAPHLPLS